MRTARVDTACSLRREGGAGDEAARCRAVSLHCARPAAAGSARLQSAVCRRRQGVVAAASSSETGGVRLSARQLKKALEAAGVDVSDCFERADLERKWALLPSSQQQAAPEVAADGAAHTADEGQAEEGTAAAADVFAWPREQLERLQSFLAEQQRALAAGEFATAARQKLEELDASLSVSSRARVAGQRMRDAALKADAALGFGAAVRKNGPGLWKALVEFKETPVGQAAWFLATAWLFLSGAFWTLLSWGFLASLMANVVAPNLLRDTLQDAVAAAAREAQGGAAGGPRGGPFGGAAGGPYGGATGGPYGGAAPRSAPGAGFSSEGRRDLSGAGPVVDVDAKVKDK